MTNAAIKTKSAETGLYLSVRDRGSGKCLAHRTILATTLEKLLGLIDKSEAQEQIKKLREAVKAHD